MGVAGCGKTSIGEALATDHGWQFVDGDKLHPPANIKKMANGTPLDDEDRQPWLVLVGDKLRNMDGMAAIGCSALKRQYRDTIRKSAETDVCFIFLNGSRNLIEKRMSERKGHFMPLSLLDSQFAALEPPLKDEMHLNIDISGNLSSILKQIIQSLNNS